MNYNQTKEEKVNELKGFIKDLQRSITLIDKIAEVVPKFNGKTPSKRLDTALKAIDKNLHFETHYNSFIIKEYGNKASDNIVHASISSSYGDGICQNGTIDGTILIDQLVKSKEYKIKSMKTLETQIDNIDNILAQYKDLQKQMRDFIDSTSYYIREEFNLKLDRY